MPDRPRARSIPSASSCDVVVRRQSGAAGVIGGNEDLAVDGTVPGERAEIAFQEVRVIFRSAEQRGRRVVGAKEAGEVIPEKAPAVENPGDIGIVFERLPADEGRVRGALDVAVKFGLRRHRKLSPWLPAGRSRCAAMLSPMSA